ncbi:MAG: prolyl aminopeptidase [Pseudonocardiales bacterium]|nr:prolyl aminopeptidase [Pseudonocardiales bacterium]
MAELYPPVEPYAHGMLDVGDDNQVYWEACGNAHGKPALVVHGGPGSGCGTGIRRLFDPECFRVVLFEQRGCGRSKPHAGDPATSLVNNTTEHLIADMERLREHLGIDSWLLYGSSWGSTLSLAYAERHPERVTEIVIAGVTMTRREEIDWLYRGVGRLLPGAWEAFRDALPEEDRDGDLVAAYSRRLNSRNEETRFKAARDWCAWEDAVIAHETMGSPTSYSDRPPEKLVAFARITAHYFAHAAWLEEGQLLRDAHRLAGIPGVLIHGSLDLSSPLSTAWELAKAWPSAKLMVIQESGHTGSQEMLQSILESIERLGGNG